MKKIYEATGKEKRNLIELYNDLRAHDRQTFQKDSIGISDFVMVGRTNRFPFNSVADIQHWNLNGLMKDDQNSGEIIVIEPLEEQINKQKFLNFSEINTSFKSYIKLSDRAIVLMPAEKYNELYEETVLKDEIDNMNVRLYEGEEDLAIKMIFFEKNYIYLEMTKDGYLMDKEEHPDSIEYTKTLLEKQKQIAEEMQNNSRQKYTIKKDVIQNKARVRKERNNRNKENLQEKNYRMITGLTNKQEGDISLDDELYASTDIGKIRDNQEDALLLIKDKENPDFKMMVVADGMGGWQAGEVASDAIVNRLKDWFEDLNEKEKQCYYNSVSGLEKSLRERIVFDIQSRVESKTWYSGGSTLVCAIVGKNDTLIANIGDSRAYIIKNGKLEQVSREDTVAQENLEMGKTPSKEASRFDRRSNELLQCIGMDRRELKLPHFQILNNKDYDMLLLFSDGVTDCLSEDDIAVVCKNSNRKEVTKQLVEKAIRHDSIEPEEYMDYEHLNSYIPGGKDNATAVAYVPGKNEETDR